VSYPVISKHDARVYLQAVQKAADEGLNPPSLPEVRYTDEGDQEEWEAVAQRVAAKLIELAQHLVDERGQIKGADFEAAAGPEIHQMLPEHPALADPEFWIWLTLSECQEIVDRRYSGTRNLKNFGIGGAGENLIYRLWLRAEIAHFAGKENEYELALVGDVDFWRSHIFRQSYGEVRPFVRALVEFQFPAKNRHKPRLKNAEIRELAKLLKRARTNLMFEVMSQDRAGRFILAEWERLRALVGVSAGIAAEVPA